MNHTAGCSLHHQSIICTAYPSKVGGEELEPIPADVRREAGFTVDRSPVNYTKLHVFELWEEAGVPKEKYSLTSVFSQMTNQGATPLVGKSPFL